MAKKKKPGQGPSGESGAVEVSPSNAKKPATPTLVLEASSIGDDESKPDGAQTLTRSEPEASRPEMIPAGTHCKILLLDGVSASKSKPGDAVRARLLEPVFVDSKLALPAGSLIEGKVIKKTPPRRLSRAGSLYFTFTELTLLEGKRIPITASLAGAELDVRSHTKMDAEGQLHGERPGKAWMAINLGMTAGIAKEVDDGVAASHRGHRFDGDRCFHRRDGADCFELRVGHIPGNSSWARRSRAPIHRDGHLI